MGLTGYAQMTATDNYDKKNNAPDKSWRETISPDNVKLRRSIHYSLWDGIFCTGMVALTETFAVAAAIALKVPVLAIAIMGSMPLFIGSIGQFLFPSIIDSKKGRKFYVVISVFLQGSLLTFCAVSGLFPLPLSTWIFVISFIASACSGNATASLWIAWMGELIPKEIRGRVFAWRNRLHAITHLICVLTVGFIARKHSAGTTPWSFFIVLFIAAGFFRLVSALFLAFQHEPPPTSLKRSNVLKFNFKKPFILYATATALLQGATAIAGPFFNVWYIRDLGFNYLTLSICTASVILGTVLFLPLWGKISDLKGNYFVMRLCSISLALIPLPYLFFESKYAIWAFNFYSGICWSGFNLANFNYLLEACGEDDKDKKISFVTVLSGVSVFLFGLLGGYLAPRLPIIFDWRVQSLFLLSSVTRIAVVVTLFQMLDKHVAIHSLKSALEIFNSIPGYRSGMGVLRTMLRAFRRQ